MTSLIFIGTLGDGHGMTRDEEVAPTDIPDDGRAAMADEVRAGLTAVPLPTLPSKYFYDARGGALFDEITRLPEYYLTRAEIGILEREAGGIAARAHARHLLELGSGAGTKVRLLLDALARAGPLESCTLVDLNRAALDAALRSLAGSHPRVALRGIVADFVTGLAAAGPGGSRMVAFLGSTIGNLHPTEVPAFFRRVRAILAPGDAFLLGVDLVKDPARLEAAYDDAAGVTAEFNRNILRVVNARLGADFDPSAFDHVAFFDAEAGWIEMRLRAVRAMRVRVPAAGLDLAFAKGDEIRTEISCKYTRGRLESLASGTGLAVDEWHPDAEGLFAVALLRPTGADASG